VRTLVEAVIGDVVVVDVEAMEDRLG